MFYMEFSVFPMRCHVDVLLLRIIELYYMYINTLIIRVIRLRLRNVICGSNFSEKKVYATEKQLISST